MGRQEYLKRIPSWLSKKAGFDQWEIIYLMETARNIVEKGAWVLDAGAGECRYKEFFRHAHYIGLDFALGDASWDYGKLDVIGDLLHIPIADNAFDAVICTQVLEHVCEPKRVLCEINRVLRPGGHLFLSAPQWWFQHQKPHDYYRYTFYGLQYLFEQSGFDIIFIKPMGGYFCFLSVVLQGLHAHLFPDQGPKWLKWFISGLRRFTQLIFWSLVPLMLFPLDTLDREKDFTIGYTCHCIKRVRV